MHGKQKEDCDERARETEKIPGNEHVKLLEDRDEAFYHLRKRRCSVSRRHRWCAPVCSDARCCGSLHARKAARSKAIVRRFAIFALLSVGWIRERPAQSPAVSSAVNSASGKNFPSPGVLAVILEAT